MGGSSILCFFRNFIGNSRCLCCCWNIEMINQGSHSLLMTFFCSLLSFFGFLGHLSTESIARISSSFACLQQCLLMVEDGLCSFCLQLGYCCSGGIRLSFNFWQVREFSFQINNPPLVTIFSGVSVGKAFFDRGKCVRNSR